MEVAGIVFHQVVLMFCLIGMGVFLAKKSDGVYGGGKVFQQYFAESDFALPADQCVPAGAHT